MKAIKSSLLLFAICAGLTSAAQAIPIVVNLSAPPVGDIPKNGTGIGGGNSNNAENNFFRLENFLADNNIEGAPIFDGAFPGSTNDDVDVTGFAYAVIHYGSGRGGTPGGGIAFFSIMGDGTFSFPDTGLGPNGLGGFSSLDLFICEPHQVPDGGATAVLLGAALAGIGLLRRYVKR